MAGQPSKRIYGQQSLGTVLLNTFDQPRSCELGFEPCHGRLSATLHPVTFSALTRTTRMSSKAFEQYILNYKKVKLKHF